MLDGVPVFGIKTKGGDVPLTEGGWIKGQDGTALFYIDPNEAKQAKNKVGMSAPPGTEIWIEVTSLGNIWWDRSATLKASQASFEGMNNIPKELTMDSNIRFPIYGIDGFAVRDPDQQQNFIPLFFDKRELIGEAMATYGSKEATEARVMVSDLGNAVSNMLRGPAGLLRDAFIIPPMESVRATSEFAGGMGPAGDGVGVAPGGAPGGAPAGGDLFPDQNSAGGLFPGR